MSNKLGPVGTQSLGWPAARGGPWAAPAVSEAPQSFGVVGGGYCTPTATWFRVLHGHTCPQPLCAALQPRRLLALSRDAQTVSIPYARGPVPPRPHPTCSAQKRREGWARGQRLPLLCLLVVRGAFAGPRSILSLSGCYSHEGPAGLSLHTSLTGRPTPHRFIGSSGLRFFQEPLERVRSWLLSWPRRTQDQSTHAAQRRSGRSPPLVHQLPGPSGVP